MFNNKASIVMSIAAVSFAMSTGIGYAAEMGVVTVDSLNIRSGPSTSYSIKAKVDKGTVVSIGKESNGWYEVSLANGITGWASGKYIEISTDSTVRTGEILDATYLRKTASWSAVKGEVLKKGTKVEVISADVNWTKVKYNGNVGYIANNYIKVTEIQNSSNEETSGKSTGQLLESVYLRKTASWSAVKGEVIPKGTKVEVISADINWTKVKYNGEIGYVANEHIKVTTLQDNSNGGGTEGATSKVGEILDATYLRETASWSAVKGEVLQRGVKVDVVSEGADWTKVKYKGKDWYIANSYIKVTDVVSEGDNSAPDKEESEPTNTGKILEATYLRDSASWSANKLVVLQPGTTVQVISRDLNWTKVKYGLQEGYVGNAYIEVKLNQESSSEREEKIKAVVSLAKAQLGKPYEWGAEGPNSFDCSGLMYYVYKNAAGITLPRVSRDQAKVGTAVSYNNMEPGDLIAFDFNKDGVVTHIGMYIGNGEFIHSLKPGTPVQITSTSSSYWKNAIAAIRRVL